MVRAIQVIAMGVLVFVALYSFLAANLDQAELQDVSFASAFAVDKVEDDFRVTLQVINPIRLKQNTTTQQPATLVYSAIGKTLGDAINRLFLQIPQQIKLNALQLILIQEELVEKQSIIPIAQYFVRNHDISQSPPMVIVREGEAADILQMFLPFNDIGSESIVLNIQKIRSKISDFQYFADDILYINDLPGKDITLPAVKLIGNEEAGENPEEIPNSVPPAIVRMDGMALFKEGKIVGHMTEEERRLFGYYYEINSYTSLTASCSKAGYVSLKITKNNSHIYVSDWTDPDQPKVTIKIDLFGFLDSYQCTASLEHRKDLHHLEGDIEKRVRDNMLVLYERSKRLHTDFIGIESALYREDAKKWKAYHQAHANPLQDITLEVIVDMQMNSSGDLKGSKAVEQEDGL